MKIILSRVAVAGTAFALLAALAAPATALPVPHPQASLTAPLYQYGDSHRGGDFSHNHDLYQGRDGNRSGGHHSIYNQRDYHQRDYQPAYHPRDYHPRSSHPRDYHQGVYRRGDGQNFRH